MRLVFEVGEGRDAGLNLAIRGEIRRRILAKRVLHAVWSGQKQGRPRRAIFAEVWELANERPIENFDLLPRAAVPYLDEPWYC